jgi:hypothetical protein
MLVMESQPNLYSIEDNEEGEYIGEDGVKEGVQTEGMGGFTGNRDNFEQVNQSQLVTPGNNKETTSNLAPGSITNSANKAFG